MNWIYSWQKYGHAKNGTDYKEWKRVAKERYQSRNLVIELFFGLGCRRSFSSAKQSLTFCHLKSADDFFQLFFHVVLGKVEDRLDVALDPKVQEINQPFKSGRKYVAFIDKLVPDEENPIIVFNKAGEKLFPDISSFNRPLSDIDRYQKYNLHKQQAEANAHCPREDLSVKEHLQEV